MNNLPKCTKANEILLHAKNAILNEDAPMKHGKDTEPGAIFWGL